jgi:CHAT domain-containing protein
VSPFAVGWSGEPRTLIEIGYSNNKIHVRYAPGHRSTVRIPCRAQPFDFKPIDSLISRLGMGGASREGEPSGAGPAAVDATAAVGPNPELLTLGSMLCGAMLPNVINELQRPTMNVELGISENLLHYPWELMHDDVQFLCERHNVARYINATSIELENTKVPSWWGTPIPEIKVLIVSVPRPDTRPGGKAFEELPWAASEADKVTKTIAAIPGCRPTWLPNPSMFELHREMSTTRYHIIHYCGHAAFGGKDNQQGCLVLQTDDMPAQVWKTLVQRTDAVVCVLNGCDTARQDALFAGGQYGLARAVLDTGAYLVGPAWNVNDSGAAAFAPRFYDQFLGDGASIGLAIRDARAVSRTAVSAPAWASYVLYGDPRLRLERAP